MLMNAELLIMSNFLYYEHGILHYDEGAIRDDGSRFFYETTAFFIMMNAEGTLIMMNQQS